MSSPIKKYDTTADLKVAIKSLLGPKQLTKSKRSDKTPIVASKKSETKAGVDKKELKASLNDYLAKQKLLSGVIKDEIRKAFVELRLI